MELFMSELRSLVTRPFSAISLWVVSLRVVAPSAGFLVCSVGEVALRLASTVAGAAGDSLDGTVLK